MELTYIKSEANFICIFIPVPAKQLMAALLTHGIIIRPLESFGLPNAIRVTIGLAEHNHKFINALKKELS